MPISSVPYTYGDTYTGSKKLTLLTGVDSDLAALTASSEVAGLPISALQEKQPANKWRTLATYAYMDFTFPYPVAVNTLALIGGSLSSGGLLRCSSAASQADLGVVRTFDTGWKSAWWYGGKPITQRWSQYLNWLAWENDDLGFHYRVEVADAGAPFLQFGRVMLGRRWQPTTNFDVAGTPLSFAPTDLQIHTPYGRTFTSQRNQTPPRIFELTALSLNRREAFDGIYEIQRLIGMHGDVVCVIDPGATSDFHRLSMQGHFTAGGAYTAPLAVDKDGFRYGAAIKLREFL